MVTRANGTKYFTNPLSFMRDNHNNLAIIRSKSWKTPTRPKVTIAIGIISKSKTSRYGNGQIVLASDSQTTFGSAKSLDTKKISVVKFSNCSILVVQAGSADLADRAIEIPKEKAKELPMEDYETAANLVQKAG